MKDSKSLQTLSANLSMLSVRCDRRGYKFTGDDVNYLRLAAIQIHRMALDIKKHEEMTAAKITPMTAAARRTDKS